MNQRRATMVGFSAVLMWSMLALLTIGTAPVPPLQLNAICFGLGGLIGLSWMLGGTGTGVLRGVNWKVYAFGTLGLFGYHFLYFTAFRWGPGAATGLIAYLWPLFIVLFSGLLPGERLTARHVTGAVLAFAGVAVIIMTSTSGVGGVSYPALILAFLCALTWSCYSVISRRLGAVPTEAVTVFCLATSILSAVAHFWVEDTVWPATAAGWICILALGIGPVGLAFFTWDIGMKRGNIQTLGVASYAAPLLSTLALVLAGKAHASFMLLIAAVMVAGGAALAARTSNRPVQAP